MSRENKQKKLGRRREKDFRAKRVDRAWEKTPANGDRESFDNDEDTLTVFSFGSYAVTGEYMEDHRALPVEVLAGMGGERAKDRLNELVYRNPHAAIAKLEALLRRYPGTPTLLNWLSVACIHAGLGDSSRDVTALNYRLNPDYLFAKTNYLSILVTEGNLEEAKELVNGKFDLHQAYPHRSLFHSSEFIAHAYAMVLYHIAFAEWEQAFELVRKMQRVDPQALATVNARKRLVDAAINKRSADLHR